MRDLDESTTANLETTQAQDTTALPETTQIGVTTIAAAAVTTAHDAVTMSAVTADHDVTTSASVSCQPFPRWYNIELSSSAVIAPGVAVTYQCKSGYEFGSGDSSKTSTCSEEDGSWSPSFKWCDGITQTRRSITVFVPPFLVQSFFVTHKSVICCFKYFKTFTPLYPIAVQEGMLHRD